MKEGHGFHTSSESRGIFRVARAVTPVLSHGSHSVNPLVRKWEGWGRRQGSDADARMCLRKKIAIETGELLGCLENLSITVTKAPNKLSKSFAV